MGVTTKIQELDGCKRRLSIEVPRAVVDETFNQVYKDIGKTAVMPGFRKGKVPRDLLEKNYQNEAREEVIRRLISRSYSEAIEESKLFPVGVPEVTAVKLEPGKPLTFDTQVEVKPEVKLKNYKGLKIKKKKKEVTEEAVKKTLKALQEMRAKEVPKEKDGSGNKDKANPIRNIKDSVPESKISNGVKKEKQLPALDDEFAKGMGYETLKELEQAVKKDLLARQEAECKADMEKQVLDQVLKTASLEVPNGLAESELSQMVERAKRRMLFKGGKKEEIESQTKSLTEKLRGNAVERIKTYFILDKIAELEGIEVTSEDLDKRIEAIALRSGQTPEEVRNYIEKDNLEGKLGAEIRQEKAMEFLLREAKQV